MKNSIIFCLSILPLLSFGQLISKNGHTVLPEEGEWSLQMNAIPLLNSLNILNDNGGSFNHPGYVSGFENVIVAKKYASNNSASRIKLGLNTALYSNTIMGENPDQFGSSDVLLYTINSRNFELTLGYGHEYRKGISRVQGFYGWETIFKLKPSSGDNYNYEYDYLTMYNSTSQNEFIDSQKIGGGFGLEARGFIGVDYFIAPKMSIGAEFGWGAMFEAEGKNSITSTQILESNSFGSVDLIEMQNTVEDEKRNASFIIAVDNMNAALNISFIF